MDEFQRTQTYASVTFGFITFYKQKSSSAAAADVAAAATTAAAAVGQTKPGLASLYGRLVGLTIEPFVHVFDFVVCFLIPHLEIRHN